MRTVAGIVAATILGLILIYAVSVMAHGPAANCDNEPEDVNDTCNVTGVDVALVKLKVGVFYNTWTPTPTPTETPTFTPTPLPTATPTPDLYTVADLIEQTEGNHDGTLCSGYNYGDWETEGRAHYNAPSGGTDQMTAWGVFQGTTCGSFSGNTASIRNLSFHGWNGTTWVDYGITGSGWCSVTDPQTVVNQFGCNGGDSGPTWTLPEPDPVAHALHWASSRDAYISGTTCFVTLFEAKKAGSAGVMANAGADQIDNGNILGDMFLGSFVALTTSYQWIGGTNCTSTVLNANPPPGVSP